MIVVVEFKKDGIESRTLMRFPQIWEATLNINFHDMFYELFHQITKARDEYVSNYLGTHRWWIIDYDCDFTIMLQYPNKGIIDMTDYGKCYKIC